MYIYIYIYIYITYIYIIYYYILPYSLYNSWSTSANTSISKHKCLTTKVTMYIIIITNSIVLENIVGVMKCNMISDSKVQYM